MSVVKEREYWFPNEMWNIIKEFAGVNGKIHCQCDGYYLHTSKNTDGFAIYDYNTCKYIWCCKKYYEHLYFKLYEKHSIWKYILKDKQKSNFVYKFNYFNKNKQLLLQYILLENNNNDSFGRRKTLEKMMLDCKQTNNKNQKYKNKRNK
jgi:hypothetical protein